jgi:hypothetical protein
MPVSIFSIFIGHDFQNILFYPLYYMKPLLVLLHHRHTKNTSCLLYIFLSTSFSFWGIERGSKKEYTHIFGYYDYKNLYSIF